MGLLRRTTRSSAADGPPSCSSQCRTLAVRNARTPPPLSYPHSGAPYLHTPRVFRGQLFQSARRRVVAVGIGCLDPLPIINRAFQLFSCSLGSISGTGAWMWPRLWLWPGECSSIGPRLIASSGRVCGARRGRRRVHWVVARNISGLSFVATRRQPVCRGSARLVSTPDMCLERPYV